MKSRFLFGVLIVLALAAIGLILLPRRGRLTKERECLSNVLFILLDAARADHFHCYGYEKNTTPRINEEFSLEIDFQNRATYNPPRQIYSKWNQ